MIINMGKSKPEQSKSTTQNGTVTPDAGYALSSVSVNVQPNLQNKTVTPTNSQQTVNADSGYDGLGTVTVNAKTISLQNKTVTPSASSQNITKDTGYEGLDTVTVNGDADLVAGNIKAGVEIFGTSGNFTSDATAAAGDIRSGKTAYVNGSKLSGTAQIIGTIPLIASQEQSLLSAAGFTLAETSTRPSVAKNTTYVITLDSDPGSYSSLDVRYHCGAVESGVGTLSASNPALSLATYPESGYVFCSTDRNKRLRLYT